jgi:hypothetical protein
MIREVSRGFILVELDGCVARVPGEMFFLPGQKVGFTVFNSQFIYWDRETKERLVTPRDREEIFRDIKSDFEKGGHIFEVD